MIQINECMNEYNEAAQNLEVPESDVAYPNLIDDLYDH